MSPKAAKKKKAPAKKAAVKKKAAKKEHAAPKEAPAEAPKQAIKMKPAPTPNVVSRFNGTTYKRRAKGYSLGELASVGLNRTWALSLHVPIDIRRRSTLQWNVDALKGWHKPAPKKPTEPRAEKPPKHVKKAAKKSKKK